MPSFEDYSKLCKTPEQQFLAKIVELMQSNLSVQKEILSELKQLNSSTGKMPMSDAQVSKPVVWSSSAPSLSLAQLGVAQPTEQSPDVLPTGN